ncbi:MAG TPA: PQQ-binding-like beta-propeller repeat protein [Verrucomicrobiae bacterium]|nr:PQQ-binding-like beta-propeller repeat protein [Verrucomicrobiae bacterium]
MRLLLTLSLIVWFPSALPSALADDWPQWMGPLRDDVWREKRIVQQFPANGPQVLWRTSIQGGYSGPSVVGNRLFLMDRPGAAPVAGPADGGPSTNSSASAKQERVLCLDAFSGKPIWEHSYPCTYAIGYPGGPRTTPTVAGGRVYTLGAMGDLLCLRADNGQVIWHRSFPEEYKAKPPVWGWAAHPLLDGDRLICTVGASNAAVVAFQKDTGKELWRALNAVEIGYVPPVIYTVNGKRQLIIWHPDAVTGLVPESGKVLWSQPYPVGGEPQRPEVTIALPRLDGDKLFLTCFYHGSMLLQLAPEGPRIVWNRRSSSDEVMNDGLHTVLGTPLFKDGYIYGVCGFGELRCLDARSGDRRWETYAATGGHKGFFANAFLTTQADRTFLWNDQGELILAKLAPDGYHEISRAKLLEPLEKTRGRTITWCHPAYAHRCMYVHNGKDLICVSLAG